MENTAINDVCAECGKVIKGKMTRTSPPILLVELGLDSPKSYHPKCYERLEAKGVCGRCSDKLADIPDPDFHNVCHDYLDALPQPE